MRTTPQGPGGPGSGQLGAETGEIDRAVTRFDDLRSQWSGLVNRLTGDLQGLRWVSEAGSEFRTRYDEWQNGALKQGHVLGEISARLRRSSQQIGQAEGANVDTMKKA